MELGFRQVIVMTFGCKKQKTQLTLAKTQKAHWLVSKKSSEVLLQSEGSGISSHAMSLGLHFSQSCLLPHWLCFQAGFILVVARGWPAIPGSHPYCFKSSGKEKVLFLLVSSA